MNPTLQSVIQIATPIISLIGIYLSYKATTNKVQIELEKNQAVMQKELNIISNRIDDLSNTVKEHNSYDGRIIYCEKTIDDIKKAIEKLQG